MSPRAELNFGVERYEIVRRNLTKISPYSFGNKWFVASFLGGSKEQLLQKIENVKANLLNQLSKTDFWICRINLSLLHLKKEVAN